MIIPLGKTIIAGGRDTEFTRYDVMNLGYFNITEVVCGMCRGVDREGEKYANIMGLPVTRFPARWELFGAAAGPIRNAQMAEYADSAILFPGGRGTASMRRLALESGLNVIEIGGK